MRALSEVVYISSLQLSTCLDFWTETRTAVTTEIITLTRLSLTWMLLLIYPEHSVDCNNKYDFLLLQSAGQEKWPFKKPQTPQSQNRRPPSNYQSNSQGLMDRLKHSLLYKHLSF